MSGYYFTRSDVAALLGVSTFKLRALINAGAFPEPERVPRQGRPYYLWSVDDLRLWASNQLAAEGLDTVAIILRAAGTTLPATPYSSKPATVADSARPSA